MNTVTRPAAFFIADDRALDFLNSIAQPNDTEFEWLANDNDILHWLVHAELLQNSELDQFRKVVTQVANDQTANKIRQLREWFREFIITHAGSALAPTALQQLKSLNEILAKGKNYIQLESLDNSDSKARQHKVNYNLQGFRHWQNADDLLIIIAETIAKFICSADFTLVKNCEGPSCTLWFYDVSKNHSRRWCTMSICGNRAKAALHRAKKKSLKQTKC